MSKRVVVPAPSILTNTDPNRRNIEVSLPTKVTTILTNLQRRNVQTQSVAGPTELSIFQMAAQGEVLQLEAKLNSHGVDINQRDERGFSPLLWAAANGQKTVVELLLFRGADVTVKGLNGENALLLAACWGHLDVVVYLLKAGMNVNASDELGNTALMFAAFNSHMAVVSTLLEWGADVTAVNAEGWDALQITVRRGARLTQQVIEKHLASLLTYRASLKHM